MVYGRYIYTYYGYKPTYDRGGITLYGYLVLIHTQYLPTLLDLLEAVKFCWLKSPHEIY